MTDTTGKRITDWLKQGGDIFAELGKDAGEYFSQIMPDLEKTLRAKIVTLKAGGGLETLVGYLAKAGADKATAVSLMEADMNEHQVERERLTKEAASKRRDAADAYNLKLLEAGEESNKLNKEADELMVEAGNHSAHIKSLEVILNILKSQEEAEEEKIA